MAIIRRVFCPIKFLCVLKRRGVHHTVYKQRPKNLNLLTIQFPIPAIVSILHRISGVVLFLMIPLILWVLTVSLNSPEDFQRIHDSLATPFAKIVVLVFLAPFLFHFVAGIRHLLMDMNIGSELKSGRLAAILTIVISFILVALAGFYIW
jgi:succinate dehydrogenase / fumarate reductase cytochrome b subunit